MPDRTRMPQNSLLKAQGNVGDWRTVTNAAGQALGPEMGITNRRGIRPPKVELIDDPADVDIPRVARVVGSGDEPTAKERVALVPSEGARTTSPRGPPLGNIAQRRKSSVDAAAPLDSPDRNK